MTHQIDDLTEENKQIIKCIKINYFRTFTTNNTFLAIIINFSITEK
jgi:hypothetical protein